MVAAGSQVFSFSDSSNFSEDAEVLIVLRLKISKKVGVAAQIFEQVAELQIAVELLDQGLVGVYLHWFGRDDIIYCRIIGRGGL
jgi:bifunctional ADP-heptose synthase (sugar kinase/adenylyltransferase)